MAELRRWNTGDGVPAPAVDYGSYDLAPKNGKALLALTEARNRAGRPCRGGGVDGERRRTEGQDGPAITGGEDL